MGAAAVRKGPLPRAAVAFASILVLAFGAASVRCRTPPRSVAAAGCELRHLPAYSPDYNPIEQAFAKIKTALRRAGARTFDGLVAAAKLALDAVTPDDARGFYRAAGYSLRDGQPL